MPRPPHDYDAYQESFHDAFRDELFRIVDRLPLPPGGRILDAPCGNGFYTHRLAARVAERESLSAIDASAEFVEQLRESLPGARVSVADSYRLPFPENSFDLVWCAQSLISLDPALALREMARVVKDDGVLAVLETDEFHHLLLPWPDELEIAILAAIREECVSRFGNGVKLSPARRLRRLLKQAGFAAVRRATRSIDRAAPFDPPTRTYLKHHVEYLRSWAYDRLSPSLRETFDRLTDEGADGSILNRADSEFTCLNVLYTARKTALPVVPRAGRNMKERAP